MKKYIVSGIVAFFAATAFAQPVYHNQQHRPNYSQDNAPVKVREIYNVKVKKENRNFYRITQGVTGARGQTVFVRTDACRIRHGTGTLRLNIDRRNPGMETGSMRINGVQCRVLDVDGFTAERPNNRPHYRR